MVYHKHGLIIPNLVDLGEIITGPEALLGGDTPASALSRAVIGPKTISPVTNPHHTFPKRAFE